MPFSFETEGYSLLPNKILAVRKIMKRQFQFVCVGVPAAHTQGVMLTFNS